MCDFGLQLQGRLWFHVRRVARGVDYKIEHGEERTIPSKF